MPVQSESVQHNSLRAIDEFTADASLVSRRYHLTQKPLKKTQPPTIGYSCKGARAKAAPLNRYKTFKPKGGLIVCGILGQSSTGHHGFPQLTPRRRDQVEENLFLPTNPFGNCEPGTSSGGFKDAEEGPKDIKTTSKHL